MSRQALIIVHGPGRVGLAERRPRSCAAWCLGLREQTFVEAARSLGASNSRIIFLHMIPNSMAPIIVNASLGLAGYIIYEAALSFLGFGIQDPIPTWGNMLSATQHLCSTAPGCRLSRACRFSCARCALTILAMVCAMRSIRA